MKSTVLETANLYVKNNLDTLEKEFRQNFHIMPPIGWMNDPNGLVYALGKYHVFFQFHPYKAEWGPMHWGHYTSTDLIYWEWAGVALAPDAEYDSFGCFSGSAIEKDGEIYLMYTGVTDSSQKQVLARSRDGKNFRKIGVVIDSDKLPKSVAAGEFRDPKVFKRGERFYAVVGSKTDYAGVTLIFDSADLVNWSSGSILWQDANNITVNECPDLFSVNGKDVHLYCISERRDGGVVQKNLYSLGSFDEENRVFTAEKSGLLDYGDSFYAAQTLQTADGRVVLFAWLNAWSGKYYTAPHGWVGSLTFPRVITVKDGELIQQPIEELNRLFDPAKRKILSNVRVEGETELGGICGTSLSLKLKINLCGAERFGIKLAGRDAPALDIGFDENKVTVFSAAEDKLYVCDSFCRDGRADVHILADKTSAEIFFAGGRRVLTFIIPPEMMGEAVKFYSCGGIAVIENLEFNPVKDRNGISI